MTSKKTRLKFSKTARGFSFIEFKDLYGQECSAQNSSLAFPAAMWLGVDKKLAERSGEPLQEVSARMHLTQAMAKQLIEVLQRFVDTGSISK